MSEKLVPEVNLPAYHEIRAYNRVAWYFLTPWNPERDKERDGDEPRDKWWEDGDDGAPCH
jgi:hypothetical protein